jgi:hypothetical protein
MGHYGKWWWAGVIVVGLLCFLVLFPVDYVDSSAPPPLYLPPQRIPHNLIGTEIPGSAFGREFFFFPILIAAATFQVLFKTLQAGAWQSGYVALLGVQSPSRWKMAGRTVAGRVVLSVLGACAALVASSYLKQALVDLGVPVIGS